MLSYIMAGKSNNDDESRLRLIIKVSFSKTSKIAMTEKGNIQGDDEYGVGSKQRKGCALIR